MGQVNGCGVLPIHNQLSGGGEDSLLAEDAAGNQVHITLANIGPVTKENGRLFLHANGEKIDITDELVETGSYHDTYEMTVVREDGSEEPRTVTIPVTGNLEAWTVTQDNGDGTATTTISG